MSLNQLYHAQILYESTVEIESKVQVNISDRTIEFSDEFWNQDSAYYYDLGAAAGKLIYWSYYDVGDFSYPSIDIEYPAEFDFEKLQFFE